MRIHLSSRWARVVLTMVSLSTSIAVAEVLTRVSLPRPGFQEITTQSPIIPHPTRGYSYSPNNPGFTNSWGLRDDPIGTDESVDILAVGDSFTVGGGLAMEEAWPSQLELSINSASVLPDHIRVVNGGVAAYSLTQIRLLTGELAEQLKPKVIVVGLFSSRYWRLDDPYVFFHGMAIRKSETQRIKVVNGGMIHTPFKARWLRSLDFFLADHFYFGAHTLRASRSATEKAMSYIQGEFSRRTLSDIQKLLEPLLREIEKMHELCASLNIRLVVMLVNEQEEDGSFKLIEKQYNKVVESFCRDLGVNVADPLPVFEELARGKPIFRQKDDHHWSSLAHKVAAKELLRVLTEENILTEETILTGGPRK
jgi:lysophospholipase L1-like esterase